MWGNWVMSWLKSKIVLMCFQWNCYLDVNRHLELTSHDIRLCKAQPLVQREEYGALHGSEATEIGLDMGLKELHVN